MLLEIGPNWAEFAPCCLLSSVCCVLAPSGAPKWKADGELERQRDWDKLRETGHTHTTNDVARAPTTKNHDDRPTIKADEASLVAAQSRAAAFLLGGFFILGNHLNLNHCATLLAQSPKQKGGASEELLEKSATECLRPHSGRAELASRVVQAAEEEATFGQRQSARCTSSLRDPCGFQVVELLCGQTAGALLSLSLSRSLLSKSPARQHNDSESGQSCGPQAMMSSRSAR